jgi:hypothetical protein
VEPSAATRAAYEALLPTEHADAAAPRSTGFVGRPAERRRLTELWQQSRQGYAQLVIVSGEPGVGKTRLVDMVAELSAVLGRQISFVHVPDEDAVAQFVANGTPEWTATNAITQFGLLRQGSQAQVRDTSRELTGREPRTLAEFIRDHAAAFA